MLERTSAEGILRLSALSDERALLGEAEEVLPCTVLCGDFQLLFLYPSCSKLLRLVRVQPAHVRGIRFTMPGLPSHVASEVFDGRF